MVFCIPFWIIAISQLIVSITALCAPLTGLVTTVGTTLMMGPMMKGIMGPMMESMMPYLEQMAEIGVTG